jgi:hypothetical protein
MLAAVVSELSGVLEYLENWDGPGRGEMSVVSNTTPGFNVYM